MPSDEEAFEQIVAGLEESEMATHIHIIVAPPDSSGYRAILSIDATEDDHDVVFAILHRSATAWMENSTINSDMFDDEEDADDESEEEEEG